MVFNLVFASSTILSWFFFFYWPAVITEIFLVIAELVIPTGIPNKEEKEEIKTRPVTAEATVSKCLV